MRTIIKRFRAVNKRNVILRNLFETHMDTFTNVVICCYMLTKNPALYFVNATESFAIILAMVFAVIDGLFLPIYLL